MSAEILLKEVVLKDVETLNLFTKKFLKEDALDKALEMDREYVLMDRMDSSKDNIPNIGRNLIKNPTANFTISVITALTSLTWMTSFAKAINLQSSVPNGVFLIMGGMMLFTAFFIIPKIVKEHIRKAVVRYLENDEGRRKKEVLSKSKTRKYWQDFFLDKKEFKVSSESAKIGILIVLKKTLAKYSEDDETRFEVGTLIEKIINKGMVKEVLGDLMNFLIIPKNKRLFIQTSDEFISNTYANKVTEINEVIDTLELKIDNQIFNKVDDILSFGEDEIVFFKPEGNHLKSKVAKL